MFSQGPHYLQEIDNKQLPFWINVKKMGTSSDFYAEPEAQTNEFFVKNINRFNKLSAEKKFLNTVR